ncbi:stage V sporulation protein D (sporulation-specific penicillin-binding protein) [Clostridium acidisoli DSM 12555]|uniref:Stage V sporulation protein D (Sporulation-specific penicillin-binding protein) n=1 Tax=Clostridium acidisoli DSM 12555 TaxID=1121291 RepID=A0A1W1XRK3_9CLOT|nr:stage V sporulation protein D (sporulation-specific penicillin-binding protein) [Clostridium acidisoli DSM 12555]
MWYICLSIYYLEGLVILKKKPHIRKINRVKRLLLIFVIFGIAFFVVVGRLFYVMDVKADVYKTGALHESITDVEITPKRGSILDRNDNELAVSIDAYRVDIDMNALRVSLKKSGTSMDDLIQNLSSILNMSTKQITKILYMKSSNGNPIKYATLIRQIDKGQADRIKALKIQGLIISGDTKRHYINNNFLASTIGYTNAESKGVTGVEASYNTELSGTPGREILEKDNKGEELPYEDSQYTPAINGKNVELTIDEKIQKYAEDAAETALKDNKAKAVTITVMNPKNGEILAMVNKPDYDPNNPNGNNNETSEQITSSWKNNAVQNTFEPGSIFKVITSYAAMAENVVNDSTRFSDPGYADVDGVRINEWNMIGFPSQTFQDIIKNSSNVGFVKLGVDLLGKDRLFKYINLFNLGQKTGIDLPGESTGIVRSINKTNKVDLANIAFGQGISLTAVQYLAAFNSVANGGSWIRPHVMRRIVHTDSNNKEIVDKTYDNLGEKTILDKNTTTTLRGYLRNVVAPGQNGVGAKADVPGLDIAGKTGTAQKSDPKTGGYAPGKYMSSFAGMAPYTDPKITMLVSIDEPDPGNYYAGSTAAPVAHDLFQEIFDYLQTSGDAALK